MNFIEKLELVRVFQEIAHIREQQRIVLERLCHMADVIVTQDQLDQVNSGIAKIQADITGFNTDVIAIGNDVEQVLTLLKNAQATGTRVDLATTIGLLTQADANLGVLDTKVKNLDTTMTAVTNPPATTPPAQPAPVVTHNDDGTTTTVTTNPDKSVTTEVTKDSDGSVVSSVTTPAPTA